MTSLIACLSSGKGTRAHVKKVMEAINWDKIFLITNKQWEEEFKKTKNTEFIMIDTRKTITEMAEEIKKALEEKIKDFEVALNIVSGEGREHMALISALLKLGLGIRLVALTKKGVMEI